MTFATAFCVLLFATAMGEATASTDYENRLNHVVDAAIAKFDSGSDHQLNETEFLSVAEGEVVNIDYLHEEFGFASAAAKAIFDVYDVDESGHLSIHEMRNLFEYLDKNGDKRLSRDELLSYGLQQIFPLLVAAPEDQRPQMFAVALLLVFDSNHDDKLVLSECTGSPSDNSASAAAAVPALTNNMQWQQFVTKMFEVHDQDGSGDVDKEELMELYEYLDQNDDHVVTLNEIVHYWLNLPFRRPQTEQ